MLACKSECQQTRPTIQKFLFFHTRLQYRGRHIYLHANAFLANSDNNFTICKFYQIKSQLIAVIGHFAYYIINMHLYKYKLFAHKMEFAWFGLVFGFTFVNIFHFVCFTHKSVRCLKCSCLTFWMLLKICLVVLNSKIEGTKSKLIFKYFDLTGVSTY